MERLIATKESAVSKPAIISREHLPAFALVGMLFPLWGFANDVTNPLVKAFKDIFLISNTQSSLVQFAFYLGYGVMAIPAALFIRRFTYKSGILLGLALYAIGAILFIPASYYAEFIYFLVALWIMTCGLALLETTANPYILSMGHPDTATQRLNLAQAFNPIGALSGAYIASTVILGQLEVEAFRAQQKQQHPEYATMLPAEVDNKLTAALQHFSQADPVAHQAMQAADLIIVRGPYLMIAVIVALLFCVFVFSRLPQAISHDHPLTSTEIRATFRRLINNRRYIEGVIAQLFYVGAQIMCWTFILHYGVIELNLTAGQAQNYNLIALALFLVSRFICTFLLSFTRPGRMLMLLAGGGMLTSAGAIVLNGYAGLYSLVAISICMSLMFPTIYGIALHGLGSDASLASAGLIMAIVGGALMPPLQGAMIDAGPILPGISSVRTSFVLPILCFMVIALYGYRTDRFYGS